MGFRNPYKWCPVVEYDYIYIYIYTHTYINYESWVTSTENCMKTNNKYVYRQSQGWTNSGSEVKWAGCSLITGTGCWVQVFSLILDSSVVCWWFGVSDFQGSNPAFSRGKQLVSFRFKIISLCQSTIKIKQQICMYVYTCVIYICTRTSFGSVNCVHQYNSGIKTDLFNWWYHTKDLFYSIGIPCYCCNELPCRFVLVKN